MNTIEIWKMVEEIMNNGNFYGVEVCRDVVTWTTYKNHRADLFVKNYLQDVPHVVGGKGGTMQYPKTTISLKYLKAWCLGYLDELLAAEDAIRESAAEKTKMEKVLKATVEISKKIQESSLAIELAKKGFSGEECFFLHDNLLVVSWTAWDTSTRSGIYCSVSTVTDYHVRGAVAYEVSGAKLKKIGRNTQRKLFRTTEQGVVSEAYRPEVYRIEVADGKIQIKFLSDTETISIEIKEGD